MFQFASSHMCVPADCNGSSGAAETELDGLLPDGTPVDLESLWRQDCDRQAAEYAATARLRTGLLARTRAWLDTIGISGA